MQITYGKKQGTVSAGRVREWRRDPTNLDAALGAAAHYAQRNDEAMVLVRGNSYGRAVIHIGRATDPLTKFTAMNVAANVLVVEVDGTVYQAVAK